MIFTQKKMRFQNASFFIVISLLSLQFKKKLCFFNKNSFVVIVKSLVNGEQKLFLIVQVVIKGVA